MAPVCTPVKPALRGIHSHAPMIAFPHEFNRS
jgi:hypothetical protein